MESQWCHTSIVSQWCHTSIYLPATVTVPHDTVSDHQECSNTVFLHYVSPQTTGSTSLDTGHDEAVGPRPGSTFLHDQIWIHLTTTSTNHG